jgi:hypothetical protein
MTDVREDVAELLRAGYGNKAIARRLHMDTRPIAAARAELGLPNVKAGRRPASAPIDLFWQRVQRLDDGHLAWTGYRTTDGTPAITTRGRVLSARRIAWRAWHGRDPVGYVRPGCGLDECVAPDHATDRPMRAANRRADKAFPTIFGGAS